MLVGPSGAGKTHGAPDDRGPRDDNFRRIFIGDTLVNDGRAQGSGHRDGVSEYALYPHHNVRGQHELGPSPERPKQEIVRRVQGRAAFSASRRCWRGSPKSTRGAAATGGVGRAIVRQAQVSCSTAAFQPRAKLGWRMRTEIRSSLGVSGLPSSTSPTIRRGMTNADGSSSCKTEPCNKPRASGGYGGRPTASLRVHLLAAMNFIEAVGPEDGAWILATEGFRVRVPETFHSQLESYAGQPVIFGLRPRTSRCGPPCDERERGKPVTGRADVVENARSEIFVYLTCGPHNVVARMEVPETATRLDRPWRWTLGCPRPHIFDKETSRTIV